MKDNSPSAVSHGMQHLTNLHKEVAHVLHRSTFSLSRSRSAGRVVDRRLARVANCIVQIDGYPGSTKSPAFPRGQRRRWGKSDGLRWSVLVVRVEGPADSRRTRSHPLRRCFRGVELGNHLLADAMEVMPPKSHNIVDPGRAGWRRGPPESGVESTPVFLLCRPSSGQAYCCLSGGPMSCAAKPTYMLAKPLHGCGSRRGGQARPLSGRWPLQSPG